jgi:HD-GYP domain-containing protein (c-di-GMP phosphodiesterase class II)
MDLNHLKQLIESADFAHSKNVSALSRLLALKAGYSEREADVIAQAALFHDVGKDAIPADILNKPGRLTPEEYALVRTHTAIGRDRITEAAEILSAAARAAAEHHERPDGLGYHRLSGREVHPYSPLIAVADVFDALYSKRVYKEAWAVADILAYFESQAGKQFEKAAVRLLFESIEEVIALCLNAERGPKTKTGVVADASF